MQPASKSAGVFVRVCCSWHENSARVVCAGSRPCAHAPTGRHTPSNFSASTLGMRIPTANMNPILGPGTLGCPTPGPGHCPSVPHRSRHPHIAPRAHTPQTNYRGYLPTYTSYHGLPTRAPKACATVSTWKRAVERLPQVNPGGRRLAPAPASRQATRHQRTTRRRGKHNGGFCKRLDPDKASHITRSPAVWEKEGRACGAWRTVQPLPRLSFSLSSLSLSYPPPSFSPSLTVNASISTNRRCEIGVNAAMEYHRRSLIYKIKPRNIVKP
ncbi:hypothetical protein LZ30DRAFT_170849 [Colletotrichum cereale]|nr:hypothetical protein LZ30DRAFT_170849 [Colletotrichum cereale]